MVVHCNMGMSRSAAIVIGYLISRLGWSYEKAYRHTKLRRAVVRPNDGFESILQHLAVDSSDVQQEEWHRGEKISDSHRGGRPHEYSSGPGTDSSIDNHTMDGEVGASELAGMHPQEQRAHFSDFAYHSTPHLNCHAASRSFLCVPVLLPLVLPLVLFCS